MEHFISILTVPDNIPIVIMVLLLTLCSAWAIYEMRENDKLIKKGEKEKIYDRMIQQDYVLRTLQIGKSDIDHAWWSCKKMERIV